MYEACEDITGVISMSKEHRGYVGKEERSWKYKPPKRHVRQRQDVLSCFECFRCLSEQGSIQAASLARSPPT